MVICVVALCDCKLTQFLHATGIGSVIKGWDVGVEGTNKVQAHNNLFAFLPCACLESKLVLIMMVWYFDD